MEDFDFKSCRVNGRCLYRDSPLSFMHMRRCPQVALGNSEMSSGILKEIKSGRNAAKPDSGVRDSAGTIARLELSNPDSIW